MLCPVCRTANPEAARACAACAAPLDARQAEAPTHLLPPGTRLKDGAYTIGKVLGQGGFGITYLGSETAAGRAVAIKEFFPHGSLRQGSRVLPGGGMSTQDFTTALDRFLDEAQVLERFSHPGIVTVYADFAENGTAYMVMEFLRGKPLGAFLESRGVLDEAEAVALIRKAGEALAKVHEAGLLHRDLKPDNIILTHDGRVVLIDFGTAREFAAERTHRMTAMLTPGYAPLEQYSQHGRFGPFTDTYALAATLYHLLTGRMPVAALDRIQGVELPAPHALNPKVSRRVSDAVMWALEIVVKDRPQQVGQLLAALGGQVAAPKPARAGAPPLVPFTLEQEEARTVGELAELVDRFPAQAAVALYEGRLDRWLTGALGQPALGTKARTLAAERRSDPKKGLELVARELHRAAGRDPGRALEPAQDRLDLGSIPAGSSASGLLQVKPRGRGAVWGSATLEPPIAGLSVPPAFDTTGGTSGLEVRLDTLRVPPGEHGSTLVLRAEGLAAPVQVPVQFRVEPLEVTVEPAKLDLGRVPAGGTVFSEIRLEAKPAEGRLVGTANVKPAIPGVKTSGEINGSAARVQVEVETTRLEMGKDYATEVVIETNSGTFRVPARFRVATRWTAVLRDTLWGAASTAAPLLLFRLLLGQMTGWGWLHALPGDVNLLVAAWGFGLAALIRLGLLARRTLAAGKPKAGARAGCVRPLAWTGTIALGLATLPWMGTGWVTGLEALGQGWRSLGLGPMAAWGLTGAALGLIHGFGTAMLRAGRPALGRRLNWAVIAGFVLLGILGWSGALAGALPPPP